MPDPVIAPKSGAGRCLLVLATLVWLASCQSATRVGDRYYDRGRYPEAAAAFKIYLEAGPADDAYVARTLYRLGLIHAMPGSRVHDPQLSIETFERLLAEYPNSSYCVDARLLRDLQRTIGRLHRESDAARARLSVVESELGERTARLGILQEQLDGREQEIADLEESIPPLQGEIRSLIRELASKERELEQLEQLKAIDLAEPPQ